MFTFIKTNTEPQHVQSYLSCSVCGPRAFVAPADVFSHAMQTGESHIHLVGSGYALNHLAYYADTDWLSRLTTQLDIRGCGGLFFFFFKLRRDQFL